MESLSTKRLIAQSLKELSEEKPFDKISVGEIAARSNVNRQTFYYHFQDKYDLLKWIYKEDYFFPNMQNLNFDNWDQCLRGILESVRADRRFCVNTIRHTEQEVTELFLADTVHIFDAALDLLKNQSVEKEKTLRRVDPEEQNFIARFFAYGVCGILVEWIEKGMKEEPEVVAHRMRNLLNTCKELAYKQVLEENEEK
ncbi:MAG: TetR/AcrR family transcriptional regulator C-terminal domain-containing protein [Eubacterium sp.]|nr:TetR/AcrR family transcriptional regulator C-terminal domain-containing protein [Eubacterium sp.]